MPSSHTCAGRPLTLASRSITHASISSHSAVGLHCCNMKSLAEQHAQHDTCLSFCSLERQDLSCTYLAHHEPESSKMIVNAIIAMSSSCVACRTRSLVRATHPGMCCQIREQQGCTVPCASHTRHAEGPSTPGHLLASFPSSAVQSSVLGSSGLQSWDSLACRAWCFWCCLLTFRCSGDDCTPKCCVFCDLSLSCSSADRQIYSSMLSCAIFVCSHITEM